ncbi:hypothetical protein [Endozoicomonas acroporae]|uniref:hypothetical protein n=1 Tax=Endozoicomonas acroporae TaxID=1701104 RepID=UPI003D7BD669
MIKLTKREKKSIEFLKEFCENLLEGKTTELWMPDLNYLEKMGIKFNLVTGSHVETFIKGKSDPALNWHITCAHSAPYLKYKVSKQHLPFQVKEMKEKYKGEEK